MSPNRLAAEIRRKKSLLCVGLDPEPDKIPAHLRDEPNPIFAFNRQIIEATSHYAVAYKPNIAFYESLGRMGWEALELTLDAIPDNCLAIADAKRGDIGNTSRMYAKTFFETMPFDAITVAPYMGADSVEPFLAFEGKWTFLLALTSNSGAKDFQYHTQDGQPLYRRVITQAQTWATQGKGSLGFVVGATRGEDIAEVRALAPEAFLLVPGVGAQGGDLDAVCRYGLNDMGGLLINSSRGIIYAGADEHFAEQAADAARQLQQQMAVYL